MNENLITGLITSLAYKNIIIRNINYQSADKTITFNAHDVSGASVVVIVRVDELKKYIVEESMNDLVEFIIDALKQERTKMK